MEVQPPAIKHGDPQLVLLLVAALGFANAMTSDVASAQTIVTHRLPAALAAEAVSAALSSCAEKGYAVTATVIDADAVPIAILRGDGAGVHTVDASWAKAYTAASFAPLFKLDSGGAMAALIQRIQN